MDDSFWTGILIGMTIGSVGGAMAMAFIVGATTRPRTSTQPRRSSRRHGKVKAKTSPEELAAAYKAMNIRDDG